MTDMKGLSRVVEEEPRDIHVVYEAPLIAEPISVVAPIDDDDEEEEMVPLPEESDPEEESMEEEPVEEEPETMEDSDESIFEDRMLGEYEEQILELGCRVEELETETLERQLVMQEMEVEIAHRKETGIQMGALFHRSVARNFELAGKLEEMVQKVLSERMEKEALQTQLEMEVMDRIHFEEKWEDSNDRVGDLEDEVQYKRRKMNKMGYALRTAMERLIDGVNHYPAEQGQTRHTISRDMVAPHYTEGVSERCGAWDVRLSLEGKAQ